MSKEIMLALPEVAYLVERVPVTRVVLKPTAIHLRFCQHARESNMPLKEQCRILGVPWHARKITAPVATKASLEAARITAPSVFAQAYPGTDTDARAWSATVVETKAWPAAIRHWLAFNLLAVSDEWELVKSYLVEGPTLGNGIAPKTVIERAKERKKQRDEAMERRRAEMNMINWGGIAHREMAAYLQQANPYDAQRAMNAYQRQVMDQLYWGNNNQRQTQVEDRSPVVYDARLLEPFAYGNFTVRLLNTHEQFTAEGERMHHCVGTYFPRAKQGVCRIVSVEQAGRKHATAEFTADWELVQVKGPANTRIDSGRAVDALRAYGRRQVEPAGAVEAPKAVEADSSSWTGIVRKLIS